MFYCERCGRARRWPLSIFLRRSLGTCEVCGNTSACVSVPYAVGILLKKEFNEVFQVVDKEKTDDTEA